MRDFLVEIYPWLMALHVVSVIAWMAGMLYLPRLFVYHVDAAKGGELSETLKIMERRLMRYIMAPASIATWVFGLLMLYAYPLLLEGGWMHAKLLCVVLMTGLHHGFIKYRKAFAADNNQRSAKFYRIMNEAPTVLMIIIVVMVIVKPF